MRENLWLWELKWIAVEVAGVALGLATLESAAADLAPFILFGTVFGGVVVRYRHYTNLQVNLGPSLEG